MENLREEIERLWKVFDEYKERAEQHEFAMIAMFDIPLTSQYNDLKENWTDEHAKLFIKNMKFTFKMLGITDGKQ
jgi:uncharacterized membrane-anchored protein YhcB (DUF1043 family)